MLESQDCLDYLRKEHDIIKTVAVVLEGTSRKITGGDRIEPADLDKMVFVLESMDRCHRVEEDQVLFKLKAKSAAFDEPIRALLAEHDNARKIFKGLKSELENWKSQKGPNTLLARYISDYAASLKEHVRKEEQVFRTSEASLLTPQDHRDIIERFKKVEQNVLGSVTKGQMVATVIELQNRLSE